MRYKLSDLFELQMGKTPSRNNPNYWSSNDYSWVSISDMSSYDKYVSGTKEHISEQAVKESGIKTIPANTVIMSFKLSIGKTAITTGPIFSNEAIMAFIDKETTAIDSEYIFYLFSGRNWDEGSNKAVMGKTLNKTTLSNIEVDIPSLDVQKERIEKLNKISILIADKKQQLNQLDELIKARFVEMFSDEKCELLQDLSEKVTDGSHMPPKGVDKSEYMMLSSQNIFNELNFEGIRYLSKEDFENENRRTNIQNGDVLITIVGTIGRTHVVKKNEKFVFQRSVGVIKPVREKINGVYLSAFLQTNRARSFLDSGAHGSSQKGIYLQDLKKLPVPVAPIDKQNQFADFVAQVDKSKFAVQKSLEKTQQLFDSLMQEYFG